MLLLALIACSCGSKQNPITIIPNPVEVTPKSGNFTIDDKTFVCFENITGEDQGTIKLITESYKNFFKLTPNLGDGTSARKNYILFEINEKEMKTLATKVTR